MQDVDARAERGAGQLAATRAPEPPKGPHFQCDHCEEWFEGRPAASGLFLWTRAGETRFEEPPLCERCAERMFGAAMFRGRALADEE